MNPDNPSALIFRSAAKIDNKPVIGGFSFVQSACPAAVHQEENQFKDLIK